MIIQPPLWSTDRGNTPRYWMELGPRGYCLNESEYQQLVIIRCRRIYRAWWRHQMETFSALLALCAGNSPVIGEFPSQRPVTRSFDVFFDLRLNKRLGKQSWGWWFEMPSRPLWRHSNGIMYVPEWQTVFALTRGLLWCLFPELRSNEGNKHQNNIQVGADTWIHKWRRKRRSSHIDTISRSPLSHSVDNVTIDYWWRHNYPTNVTWAQEMWYLSR